MRRWRGAVRDSETARVLRDLRVHIAAAICLPAAPVLSLLGHPRLAAGVLAGFGLHLLNLFLLTAAGRALLGRSSSKGARGAAAGSSVGRLLLMAVGLASISRLGQAALLAACGALFASQMALHLSALWQRRSVECSERSSLNSARH